MSVDTELWTCEDGDLGGLLLGSPDWDVRVSHVHGDVFEFEGDGWLLSVSAPEAVAADEVPAELAALVDGLRFRIDLGVEPSHPPAEAWAFVGEVMEQLGVALRGAGHDPESGHAVSWAR
jgi:hypothetical protein